MIEIGNRTTLALGVLLALGLGGCDLANPTLIKYEDTDPELLLNSAIANWGSAVSVFIADEYAASDEGVSVWSPPDELDASGDLRVSPTYMGQVITASGAREQTRRAIERARELGDDEVLRRALMYRGWYIVEMARRFGDSPIVPNGDVLTKEGQYSIALDYFGDAIELSDPPADSIRLRALAGIARVQWELGREEIDVERLGVAIDAAREVLTHDPDFVFLSVPDFNFLRTLVDFFTYTPGPGFEDIPFWWNDPSQPQGNKFMDGVGLRLIIAESQLLLGELEMAKATLAAIPLLATNHVRLAGRDPAGPPLTPSEVAAFIDSLDADGVRFAISELWRENFYAQGHRAEGPKGRIWPVPLPPGYY